MDWDPTADEKARRIIERHMEDESNVIYVPLGEFRGQKLTTRECVFLGYVRRITTERLEQYPDGWIPYSYKEMQKDCRLSPDSQLNISRSLIKKGILETKRMGLPAGRHFRFVHEIWKEIEGDQNQETNNRVLPPLRKKIFERDAYRCQICGDWYDLEIDHITPRSKGGSSEESNLQTLCRVCNSRKGSSEC